MLKVDRLKTLKRQACAVAAVMLMAMAAARLAAGDSKEGPSPLAPEVYVVTNTNDSGAGSLRQAIITANNHAGRDEIRFNIPGTGVRTIKPLTTLPNITDSVVIDGLTQPGASNAAWPPTLRIELDCSNPFAEFGLRIQANNCLIRGLVINGADGSGITISGGSNQIKCNFIGTDPTGTIDRGNGVDAIFVSGPAATGNIIGGAALGEGNLLSGNGEGLVLWQQSSGTVAQGNFIGVNASASAALPNSIGVRGQDTSNNRIGGTTPGAGNIISGNSTDGIQFAGAGSSGNVIAGNFIGTDVSAGLDIGNGEAGVRITDAAHDNTIGGTAAGSRNIISGNKYGAYIGAGQFGQPPSDNIVQGNHIGTNFTGSAALGNDLYGVIIESSPGNVIGGTTASARNVISASTTFAGVAIFSEESTANLVQGNFIGTDASGSLDFGNAFGLFISSGASTNTIGGTIAGARNVISGNTRGLEIYADSTGNRVEGNYIGTDASGTAPLANFTGVRIFDGASGNTIGGFTPGTGNRIAFNTATGVVVESPSTGNRIVGNSIFSNGNLGIDLISGFLNLPGVTGNDAGDGDGGANNLQNYPVITSVSTTGTVTGTINSNPGSLIRLEFFANSTADPSGHGEGELYIGTQNVTTNIFGNASFTFNFTPVAGKPFITSTATNTLTGDTSEFSSLAAPTAVEMDSFDASAYDGGVLLEWQTGFEVDNLGFRLYREQAGKRVPITSELIAGSALLTGPATQLRTGYSYAWWDELPAGDNGAQYWLEDVDINGQSTWHGPYAVNQIGGTPPARSRAELLSRRGRVQSGLTVLAPPDAEASTGVHQGVASKTAAAGPGASLASLPAIKIAVRGRGWYTVGRQELIAAGLDPNVNPRFLRMLVEGSEHPIIVRGENDGAFDLDDTVEFYAEGLETLSTDLQVHWLVAGAEPGLRIEAAGSGSVIATVETFTSTVERRDRTIYFSALRNGERENFFGPVVTAMPVDQTINVAHPDPGASEQAVLEVALQGVTYAPHRVAVSFNGEQVGEVLFVDQQQGAAKIYLPHSLLNDGANRVELSALGSGADVSLVDHIRLTYRREFVAEENSLSFTATAGQKVTIDGFTSGGILVLDTTDPGNVREALVQVEQRGDQWAAAVEVPGDGERSLLALARDQAQHTVSVTANVPSALRQQSNGADVIMLTRTEFAGSLTSLKTFRQAQGLAVMVVDVEDVYDEFYYGQKSPEAVKEFLAYARASWKRKPAYLLLAGDASLDPKNYLALGDYDFVPTKLVDTEFMETASDDWLVDFNDDGLPEMAVGRLPFRSPEEVVAISAKIINYERGKPIDSILHVSDTNEGFNFEAALLELKQITPAGIKVSQIARGEADPATVKQRLLEAITSGQKLVTYAGHGSVDEWRGNFLTSSDAGNMTNETLTVFLMMTCLNGYFQDAGIDSLAESLLKASRGGAVAVWASSGMTLPQQQAVMSREFYRLVFEGENRRSLGEAARLAKAAIDDTDVRRTWVLIGDPTMRLK
jgi:hypothetical protein